MRVPLLTVLAVLVATVGTVSAQSSFPDDKAAGACEKHGNAVVRGNNGIVCTQKGASALIPNVEGNSNIKSNLPSGCLPAFLAEAPKLDCVVEDVSHLSDGTTSVSVVPRCSRSRGVIPCWRIVSNSRCRSFSPRGVSIAIERGEFALPANTWAQVSCAAGATTP